jgi:phosphoribosyl 1,2-cyclic phosphodiesterase
MSSMLVRFWGVRGSVPCAGPDTVRYGGNTPCVEVRCGDQVLIFDAGSGIRPLGQTLANGAGADTDTDIFFSHCHIDHMVGLPFFEPLFRRGSRVHLWAGHLAPPAGLEAAIRQLMSAPLFPIEI